MTRYDLPKNFKSIQGLKKLFCSETTIKTIIYNLINLFKPLEIQKTGNILNTQNLSEDYMGQWIPETYIP